MKIVLIIFSVSIFSLSISAQKCKFDKNGVENPPFVWMQNELPPKTISEIKGKITDLNGEPIMGAVISVFRLNADGTKFIGSNESDEKGKYCFGKLKKGKYLIKVGHRYFQRYDREVTLEPKNKKAEKELVFELDVGY